MKVLDFNKSLIEWGHYWHKMNKELRIKYGEDWVRFKFGFDWNKLTKNEKSAYIKVYKDMMMARGIPEEQIKLNF